MIKGRRALFLSYDGMTDPLGPSQVLPYLEGLSSRGHQIHLISCEKPERSAEARQAIAKQCKAAGIAWHPVRYANSPPIVGQIGNIARMRRLAKTIIREHAIDLVHCRSLLPALIGLEMKRERGISFLFDMRGYWADERVEGGLWSLGNPVHRTIFRWLKRKETAMLREADHIVSLTIASRDEMLNRADGAARTTPITVIPCCTDLAAFPPIDAEQRARSRAALNIAPDAAVAAYLGSIGTWYMLDEMLAFFKVQRDRSPASKFLFITRDDPKVVLNQARRHALPADALIIRSATRKEVPEYLAAADYGIFFIRPTFSKIASSPTKLGELMALGLPVVINHGVGDVDQILAETGAGVTIRQFDDQAYGAALHEIESKRLGPRRQPDRFAEWFDLQVGVDRFDRIYAGCGDARSSDLHSHNGGKG